MPTRPSSFAEALIPRDSSRELTVREHALVISQRLDQLLAGHTSPIALTPEERREMLLTILTPEESNLEIGELFKELDALSQLPPEAISPAVSSDEPAAVISADIDAIIKRLDDGIPRLSARLDDLLGRQRRPLAA